MSQRGHQARKSRASTKAIEELNVHEMVVSGSRGAAPQASEASATEGERTELLSAAL